MATVTATRPESRAVDIGFTFDFVERLYPRSRSVELSSGGRAIVAPDDCLLPGFVVDLDVPGLLSMNAEQISTLTAELNGKSSGFLWFTDDNRPAFQLAWKARLPSRPVSAMFAWNAEKMDALGVVGIAASPLRQAEGSLATEMLTQLSSKPLHEGGWTVEDAAALASSGHLLGLQDGDQVIGLLTTFPHQDGIHVSVGGQLADSYKGRGLEAHALNTAARYFADQGKRVVTGVANTDYAALALVTSLEMPIIKSGWSAQLGTF